MSTLTTTEIDALRQLAEWWKKNKGITFKTQDEFADKISIGRSTIGDYLRGKRFPPPSTRQKLYEITGLTVFRSQSDSQEAQALKFPAMEAHTKLETKIEAEKGIQSALIARNEAAEHHGKSKVFRIAVSGDVILHPNEYALVDTREFQRLRSIKQLGTAYLVYPSATHTRFEHSIGTLFEAQKIVNSICGTDETNPAMKIDPSDVSLIRLAALLHDLGHIPFGHSLEDETKVLKSRHDDEERRNLLLRDSQVGRLVIEKYGLEKLDLLLKIMSTKHQDVWELGENA